MASRKQPAAGANAPADAGSSVTSPATDGGVGGDVSTVNGPIGETVDPTTVTRDGGDGGSSAAPSSPKRGRGRPPGSGKKQQTASPPNIGAIQATLLSVHAIIATKIPEMAIDPAEAQMLAERIAAVEKYYPAVSTIMSGKIADHVALVGALMQVYGTRLVAIRNNRMNAQNAAELPPGATVIPLNGASPNGSTLTK